MRSATEILRDEHQLILHALVTLEAAVERRGAGGTLPGEPWSRLIAWLRAFADRNHHAKEETALFPALIKAGVPAAGGPIAVMLEEHGEGRALLATMATGSPTDQVSAAKRYIRLLRDHIDKENAILFPLAEAVLDERGQVELCREFTSLENQLGESACLDLARDALARLS
jgi:hemerythrin-like domain-containing protein